MNTTLRTSLAMLALSTVIASTAAAAESAIRLPAESALSLPAASAEAAPIHSTPQAQAMAIEVNGALLPVTAYKGQADEAAMLPIRAVAEQLGYKVKWNQADRSAKISTDDRTTDVTTKEKQYSVNGVNESLAVAPELINGQLHVPASFVEKALQASVSVGADSISITTQVQQPEQQQTAQTTGVITAIHQSDKYASVHIQGIGPDGLVLNVSEDTKYQTLDGEKLEWSDLRIGMTVQADHSLAMTLSLPPQTATNTITVLDAEMPGELLGTAGTIEEIRTDEQDNIVGYLIKGQGLTDLSQDQIVLRWSADTAIVDKGGNPVEQSSLTQGTKVIGFYEPVMTRSLPAISKAVKIVVQAASPSQP